MLKIDTLSLGDEVRFRTSPTVIEAVPGVSGGGAFKASSWTEPSTEWTPAQRPPRYQALVNKQGLIELDLSTRQLRDVPTELFTLGRLEVLRLNNNQLHALASAISRLHRLRILHLQHNRIATLPPTLCNCTHLHELDLSHNKLSKMSEHVGLMRYLKVLRLANNQFETLPHQLCDIKTLRVLDVSGNRLWHLPHTTTQMTHLQYLNIAHNRFEQLPISVCSLKNLTVLNLHGNKLLNLPPDFEHLTKLQELSVAANQLDTMPYSICQLKNLHTLDLSNNKLKSLPIRMSRMSKLKIVSAHTNMLVALPNHLEHVEYLNVTDNRLKNFSVANMKRLKHLAAGHNQLENMPLGIYNLSNLEILKLSHNQISYVSQDIELLKKLRTLDLGSNRLTSLPQVINELELLQTFNIRGNPIEAKPLRMGHQRVREATAMNGWGIRAKDVFYPDPSVRHPYDGPPVTNGYLPSHHHQQKAHFKKKTQKSKAQQTKRKSAFGTKSQSTQHAGTSKNTGTQYTPKSSVKARERPPLDSRHSASVTTLFPPSVHTHPPTPRTRGSSPKTQPPTPKSMNGTLARSMGDLSMNPQVYNSNPLAHDEIAYPMQGLHAAMSMPNLASPKPSPKPSKSHSHHHNHHHHTQQYQPPELEWQAAIPHSRRGSDKSLAVTVNETIGDRLSLGEEDYEFQPTTVTDHRLLGVCTQVEAMLNEQLMQPPPKGIFRKSINEFGTLRTLNGLSRRPTLPIDQVGGVHHTISHRHMKPNNNHVSMSAPRTPPSRGQGADTFRVTASGGMFRSSTDPNVTVYFPMNAIPGPMTITMQVDKFSMESLRALKHNVPLTENLLSIGDIVHIIQSENYHFSQQVVLTVPVPPSTGHRGKLHMLDYTEENSCSPSTDPYTVHSGYITVKTWHFSGKGAIMTKSKCRYKACKSMEAFLQHLYL